MTYTNPKFFNTKKLLTPALAIAGLCALAVAQPTFAVTPASNSFTDSNLKSCVINTYNRDNHTNLKKLTVVQLKTITNLSCPNAQIKSASGMERLTGLTSLSLNGNQISTIDLSKNTKLTYLNLNNNKIKKLDLTKQTKLTELHVRYNELSTLNVQKNKGLSKVEADNITFIANAKAYQSGSIYVLDLTNVPFFHASTTLYTGGIYDYQEQQHLMATKDRNGLNNLMKGDPSFPYVPGYTYRIKLPGATSVSMDTIAKKLTLIYKDHATSYVQLTIYLAKYGISEGQTSNAVRSLGLNYGREAMLTDIAKLMGYLMAQSHMR